jgi:hypothetical protein
LKSERSARRSFGDDFFTRSMKNRPALFENAREHYPTVNYHLARTCDGDEAQIPDSALQGRTQGSIQDLEEVVAT